MPPVEPITWAILLATVPGYLTIYFATRNSTWRGLTGDLQTILQSLALSVLMQALLAPVTVAWIYPVRDELIHHPYRVAIWLALVLLVLPFVVGVLAAHIGRLLFPPSELQTKSRFKRLIRWFIWPEPPPTLFDWAMTSGLMENRFVLIEFEDGRRVGGAYGKPGVSMSSPQERGIYLAIEWVLSPQGDFVAPVASSSGILVPLGPTVRSIRLLVPGSVRAASVEGKKQP
jgi:hypothetical protein